MMLHEAAMDRLEAIERQREDILFPALEPYDTGRLGVGDGHSLYYEEYGNLRGRPVIVLHGGPGTGATAIHPRFFDPAYYRIVILDQRGAGRSTPLGRIEQNTTRHLVEDIESLRKHLGIKRWIVFGTSWGAMLGLAYGACCPDACGAFALHGIILPRGENIDWWLYGKRRFAPDKWQAFSEFLPESERDDLLAAYSHRLFHADPAVHMPAASAWVEYEAGTSSLVPMKLSKMTGKTGEQVLAMARIEAHYFRNRYFLEAGAFLAGIRRIAHLPAFISHGRCDVVSTPDNAYELAAQWRGARLSLVDVAGHTFREPNNAAAIIGATEEIKVTGL